MEWMEYAAIRGPVGPDRFDTLAAIVAMHAGKPYPPDADPTLSDFMPPWAPRPPDDEDD
jgi:hypothetical protein